MRLKLCLMLTVVAAAGSPAGTPRPAAHREPDPEGLIAGDWVLAFAEYDGAQHSQFDTPDDRLLRRLFQLRWPTDNRDPVADPPPAKRGPPPGVPVYRFGRGRVAVRDGFKEAGHGRYRFDVRGPVPVLLLTWDERPNWGGRWPEARVAIRFDDGAMRWHRDPDFPVTFARLQ